MPEDEGLGVAGTILLFTGSMAAAVGIGYVAHYLTREEGDGREEGTAAPGGGTWRSGANVLVAAYTTLVPSPGFLFRVSDQKLVNWMKATRDRGENIWVYDGPGRATGKAGQPAQFMPLDAEWGLVLMATPPGETPSGSWALWDPSDDETLMINLAIKTTDQKRAEKTVVDLSMRSSAFRMEW